MAISVDGLISGLDTTSIVKQLIDLERRPVTLLQNKQATLASQQMAWQEVNTRLLAFETSAGSLSTASKFNSNTASFLNNSSTGATPLTVAADSTVAAGSYSVVVNQLAKEQKYAANESFGSSATALGLAGTMTLTNSSGSWNISIAASDTLDGIRTKINASGAPVTAGIINAGTSASPAYRLTLTGEDTGAASLFSVSSPSGLSFTQTQAAQDALFTLDGISVTKDSNTVTDAISGATLNLQAAGSGTVTFATDYGAIIDKVQSFVSAYNDLTDYIKEQFTYSATTNEKGALFGNSSLRNIQDRLRTAVNGVLAGADTGSSSLSFLAQAGIKTDELDHLTVDEAKLEEQLRSRFGEVRALFTSAGSGDYEVVDATGGVTGGLYDTRVQGGVLQLRLQGGDGTWISMASTGNFAYGPSGSILDGLILRTGTLVEGQTGQVRVTMGAARRAEWYAASFTEFSADGAVYNERASIEKQDKELQKQISDLEERIAKKETDLKAKFVNLETLLGQLTAQQNYLNSQLGSLSSNWKFNK